MKAYEKILPAHFLSRPNRFIARVRVEDREETVHVKNTGRCRELLTENAKVYLSCSNNPARKTKYDLVAAEKILSDGQVVLVNLDSQLPNAVALEYLRASGIFSPQAVYRREVTHGDSRFDLCVEDGGKTTLVEVKGVTLEREGIALFPDAPTERGIKHLKGLTGCVSQGLDAMVLFIIQMKGVKCFRPNDDTHPAFGDALREAMKAGVRVMAVDCVVTPDSLTAHQQIPIDIPAIFKKGMRLTDRLEIP